MHKIYLLAGITSVLVACSDSAKMSSGGQTDYAEASQLNDPSAYTTDNGALIGPACDGGTTTTTTTSQPNGTVTTTTTTSGCSTATQAPLPTTTQAPPPPAAASKPGNYSEGSSVVGSSAAVESETDDPATGQTWVFVNHQATYGDAQNECQSRGVALAKADRAQADWQSAVSSIWIHDSDAPATAWLADNSQVDFPSGLVHPAAGAQAFVLCFGTL